MPKRGDSAYGPGRPKGSRFKWKRDPSPVDAVPLFAGNRQLFNLENRFDFWEDWPGGSGAAWIESFPVTGNGLGVLSRPPRSAVAV